MERIWTALGHLTAAIGFVVFYAVLLLGEMNVAALGAANIASGCYILLVTRGDA